MPNPQVYLDVQNLTKSFGSHLLFQDISFSIAEGQKVGLIARNGTGKSTLLSILAGIEGYDSGRIVFRRDLRIGFLEQTPKFNDNDTVLEACFSRGSGDDLILKAKQILTRLKIGDLEHDMLVLDEPTNHLDLDMIEWLEGYLSQGNKTLLMVTHDRFFLDRVCSVIIELDDKRLYSYRGNYSYYLEKRQERIDNAKAEIIRANNLYRKELEWMRRMPQARGHKARYREDAFYDLEKSAKRRIEERQVRLKSRNVYIGSKIFECQYISKAWEPDKVILKDFYYNFARYEKMGIVGNNGTGKSTFVKMLLGLERPDSGRFDIGTTVKFGYYSQEGLQFDEQKKVIDVATEVANYVDLGGGKHLSASQFLQYFLFTPEQQYNYVYKLSGGEKALSAIALLFAILKLHPVPFCVLDEIDSALDDTNAAIFASFLKKYLSETQFIVITHRKATMRLADSIFGVTMEEKGVTKIVSITFEEAQRRVARQD